MILADGTFHHVYDFYEFELPFGIKLPLPHGPAIFDNAQPHPSSAFGLTKFMLLQLVAVLLVMLVFRGLAARMRGGKVVHGWFWNFWEMLALYIRDNVVRPVIGDHHHGDAGHGHDAHGGHAHADTGHGGGHEHAHHAPAGHHGSHNLVTAGAHWVAVGHPADKYLPWVWSAFFYILFCNLLGALPWLGSATGDINVTGALALTAFAATFIYGVQAHGSTGFFTNMIPKVDAPPVIRELISYGIFAIELLGLLIKHTVLAVRLFANIMGGHTALGVLLGFILVILQTDYASAWYVVTPGSLLAQVGVGLLELLVAFIQAFVFSFLSTIFIAMAIHEH